MENPVWARPLAAVSAAFAVQGDHAALCVQKCLAAALVPDALMVAMGDALCPDAPKEGFTVNAGLLTPLGLPGWSFRSAPEAHWKRGPLGVAARLARLVFRILRPGPGTVPGKASIVFDQYYETLDDQEFLAFYLALRSRPDAMFVCSDPASPKMAFLTREGRRAVAHRWGVAGMGPKALALAALSRLVAASMRARLPSGVATELLKAFETGLRVASLLGSIPARIYMRERFDMEPGHPLATAVCERYGVRHAGYMCGSYFAFTHLYAVLDFHHYGVLGRSFLEGPYSDTWPRNADYPVLGPFTAEIGAATPAGADSPRVLAAFPTTADDQFFIQEGFYREFVEAVAAAAPAGWTVIFKEKEVTAPHAAAIRQACAGRVAFRHVLNTPYSGEPSMRTPEVIANCSVAVVMSGSTTAWEALALGARVAVFELPFLRHPFESVEPRVVVRDAAGLRAAVAWLVGLPGPAWDAIAGGIVRACSKPADGRLADGFLTYLERNAAGLTPSGRP